MHSFIKNKLRTTSTAKFVVMVTVITLLLAILLTTITSIAMLGELSYELLLANMIIGLIIPLIVAPFMTNLIKEATIWEQANKELKQENIIRKKLEGEASQKAKDMQAISELAIDCAAASPNDEINKLIAEKLRDITNALGVAITTYDEKERTLTTKHIAISDQVLTVANKLVGYNLVGMKNPVTLDNEKHMLTTMVETFSDLSDVTFGAVPKPVAKLIKSTIGIGAFTGLVLSYRDKIMGTAIIAHKTGQPMLDLDVCKTLAHVAAVSIQRRNAEEALSENENKFRAIIENLSEGLLLLDEKGHLLEWNPALELLTGFKRDDVIGKFMWDVQYKLMSEEKQVQATFQNIKKMSQKIIATGNLENFDRPFDGTIYSQQGEIKNIRQTLFSVPTENGYRVGTIMHDITSQKQMEKDREDLITELKAKNKELEQFTYTVSHDLKAPLITIKGFLGLLEKDVVANKIENVKKDLARITEATEKMQRLLNELLELSRIGRIINPSQRVPFEEIAQEAIATVRGRLDDKRVKIHIANELPTVLVDRTRLIQVMQNLLDNAAKFTGKQQSPLVEIGTDGSEEDGNTIFFVKDNGAGIAAKQLERVFDLFQKLDASTEGTGIGLSLVERIIKVHGGRIWITSEGLGHGTTVWFTLPTS